MIAFIVLLIVLAVIFFRQMINLKIEIWQAMLAGAIVVLVAGQISPENVIKAINMDIILFLFGMLIVGQALESSGYLSYISYKLFKNARTADQENQYYS